MPKKLTPKPSKAPESRPYAEKDDDILDSDSEVDEFADYVQSTRSKRPAMDEDDDEEDEGGESGSDDGVPIDDDEEGDGVGFYEADDWDANASDDIEESEGEDAEVQMKSLKKGLKDIPLDTLMKAQQSMKAAAGSDSEDEMSERDRKLAAMKARLADMQRAKGKDVPEAGPSRRRKSKHDESSDDEIAGRNNKHAPAVMSSKKQVSRNRRVVDVPKVDRRDPRFSALSSDQTNAHTQSARFGFVPDMLKSELYELRGNLSAASKAERTCKLVEKPRFTAERERLEKEVARVRSRLERAQREQRERDVLTAAKREEREKRGAGKGEWYMKKAEKKELLLKAKFEALDESGGKRAVKKAIEKKRKKVAAKEKKSRPFAAGSMSGGDRKRQRV